MAFDQPRTGTKPAAQRARGSARVGAGVRNGQSVLSDLRQSGSIKLLFPRPRDAALDAVFLNSSGGITGGDRFDLTARVARGAHLRLTSQAAERIYRAMPGAPGQVRNTLEIEAGAQLDWLPQETIVFDGASLERNLSIAMHGDARLLAVEPLIFGRTAMGEKVQTLHLRDGIEVMRDGVLIWADRLRLTGDADAVLAQNYVTKGAGALASVIFAAPGAGANLTWLRAALGPDGGASEVIQDLVIVRLVAEDGFALRARLLPVLRHLSGAALPRPWMI